MDNKPKFLEKLGYWTEQIFYYLELTHTISGFLIDARNQLSKSIEPIEPKIEQQGSDANGSDSTSVDDGGLLQEDERDPGGS